LDSPLAFAHGAPVAALLLAAILATSVAGLLAAPSLIERNIFRPYWLVRRRQYHTLLTSAFVHTDFAHLFFNAFTFWAFAFALERTIGSGRFLALFLVGLLVSDLATYIGHRREPGYGTLGASGAILAVLFASILHYPHGSIYILPLPMPIPAPLFALAYLAYSWYASRRGGGRVNHEAHLAGALAGVVFVAIEDPAALGRAWHAFFGS
jgi:membrane associated rhomboid family serine protease